MGFAHQEYMLRIAKRPIEKVYDIAFSNTRVGKMMDKGSQSSLNPLTFIIFHPSQKLIKKRSFVPPSTGWIDEIVAVIYWTLEGPIGIAQDKMRCHLNRRCLTKILRYPMPRLDKLNLKYYEKTEENKFDPSPTLFAPLEYYFYSLKGFN